MKKTNSIHCVRVLALIVWAVCASIPNPLCGSEGAEMRELVKRIQPAFVFFKQGSGAVISADGLVLTNSHVLVEDKKEYAVRLGNGRPYTAKLLGKDAYGDLALLQLKDATAVSFLPLCNPDKVKAGQVCLAVGNPFAVGLRDNQPTFSLGVVSGTNQLHGRYSDSIVTDVPINPGNSGGPLINIRGELIGINGMIRPSLGLRSNTGLAFAIPVNQIKLWIPKLKTAKGKIIYHGMVYGLSFEDDDDPKTKSTMLKDVEGPASTYGFKKGDQILAVNGYPVWNVFRFASILGTFPEGTAMNIDVKRPGKKGSLTLSFQLPAKKYANMRFSFRPPRRGEKNLVIGKVDKESTAEKAGLRAGDRLMGFMGQSLKGSPMMQMLALKGLRFRLPFAMPLVLAIERNEDGKTVKKIINYLAK
jgi:S1-C subfamily serine protease